MHHPWRSCARLSLGSGSLLRHVAEPFTVVQSDCSCDSDAWRMHWPTDTVTPTMHTARAPRRAQRSAARDHQRATRPVPERSPIDTLDCSITRFTAVRADLYEFQPAGVLISPRYLSSTCWFVRAESQPRSVQSSSRLDVLAAGLVQLPAAPSAHPSRVGVVEVERRRKVDTSSGQADRATEPSGGRRFRRRRAARSPMCIVPMIPCCT